MAFIDIEITAPHATAYDSAYPTRSTENYAHALHTLLKAMDTAGTWYVTDNTPTSAEMTNVTTTANNNIAAVYNYADQAITNHRAEVPIALAAPNTVTLVPVYYYMYPSVFDQQLKLYVDCRKMLHIIYYMWMTEDDPLLLKEKLQELLVAWPLTDTEIILNEEGGQSLHVVPSWKNVDI